MKCNCCNNSFSEEKTNYICDYCGFENIGKYSVYLDDPMDKRIVSYRNSLLDSVDSVYIVLIEYKWNPEKKQFDENRKRLFSESFSKDNLNDFVGTADQFDDVTMLGFRYNGMQE